MTSWIQLEQARWSSEFKRENGCGRSRTREELRQAVRGRAGFIGWCVRFGQTYASRSTTTACSGHAPFNKPRRGMRVAISSSPATHRGDSLRPTAGFVTSAETPLSRLASMRRAPDWTSVPVQSPIPAACSSLLDSTLNELMQHGTSKFHSCSE